MIRSLKKYPSLKIVIKYVLFIPNAVILTDGSPESLRMLSERVSNRSTYEFNLPFRQTLTDIL